MTIRLTFELQLHADYHMGAGLRGGPTLDSLLLRDWDNAPLLRGSALAGLLRDGLCDLIALADNHTGATALKDSAAVKEPKCAYLVNLMHRNAGISTQPAPKSRQNQMSGGAHRK